MRLDTAYLGYLFLSDFFAQPITFLFASWVGVQHRRKKSAIIFIKSNEGLTEGRNAHGGKRMLASRIRQYSRNCLEYLFRVYFVLTVFSAYVIFLVGVIYKLSFVGIHGELTSGSSYVKSADIHISPLYR